MTTSIFLTAAGISALLHLRAAYFGPRTQVYLFKPLTMLILISMVVLLPTNATLGEYYRPLIIGGLLFGLVGDIFLMLPSRPLLFGLGAFLIGHLLYIAAFVQGITPTLSAIYVPIIIATLLISLLYFRALGSHAGRLKWPVAAYMSIIGIMGLLGIYRGLEGMPAGVWVAIGAVLFAISDGILAIKEFRQNFHAAQGLLTSTYYSAQACLAVSVLSL